jgi:riboflavin kinase/FMN adenylyltransferase
LIAAGELAIASKMLSQPYRIRGIVTHGAGRGAKIGFPTANLAGIDTLLPAAGVYGGRAWVSGERWPAAINLGTSPTFGDSNVRVEIHLIGQNESLYGQPMEVDFVARLRDIRPFPSVDALVEQLRADVAQAKQLAAT